MASRSGEMGHLPWFASGDVDGFFGLFLSGFPDLLLIVGLAPVCGFSAEFVTRRVLPGVALSVLAGNLFYAWQARRLARATGRADVTAIPFGVNTPTIFAYVFLIMGPVYAATKDATQAWHAGIFASLLSGVVQTLGAFCMDWLRRHTPRAALLCPLAGLSLAYLCLGFVFGVFAQPAVALAPMIVLFGLYASRIKLPGRVPPALVALGLGALLAAVLRHFGVYTAASNVAAQPGIYLPHAVNVIALLGRGEWWAYLGIIVPLAGLDVLASLQILESVKAAGDDYATRPSLLMNGVATLAAACLGSPFPTTLYVGHASHKANGARAGYSALNGLVTLLLCLTGVLPLVLRVIPLEVAGPVVVWFGLVTVGQAFVEIPARQAVVVAFGLVPMLAQWATTLVTTVLSAAGSSLAAAMPVLTAPGSELALGGLIALGQGGLLTSMVWAASLALAVQRRFLASAGWMLAAAVLSAFGVIHAYTLTSGGAIGRVGLWAAPEFALAYAAGAGLLAMLALLPDQLSNQRGEAGL